MLSDEELRGYEAGLIQYGELTCWGRHEWYFEALSPNARAAISRMLATIRELQEQVKQLGTDRR